MCGSCNVDRERRYNAEEYNVSNILISYDSGWYTYNQYVIMVHEKMK